MFHVSQGGAGIPIPSSQVTTIKRNDSVSGSADQPQIFKKRLLKFPVTQRTSSSSALARNIIQAKREYDAQLQAREVYDDVADFEKRILGKKMKLPPPINIAPPTSEQLSLLRTFQPPSPTKFFDVYKNSSENTSDSPNEQKIKSELASLPYSQKYSPQERKSKFETNIDSKTNSKKARPAVWTLLDEPIIPSRMNIEYKPEKSHKKPFYSASTSNNQQGIPAVVRGFNEYNKKQNVKFEKSVRAQCETDNINYDKQIQERVHNNMQKTREKHEKTSKLIVESGQDWPQKLITKKQIEQNQKKLPKPKPLSKDDIEALEFLERRDEQIWAEMKEKEKQKKLETITKVKQQQKEEGEEAKENE